VIRGSRAYNPRVARSAARHSEPARRSGAAGHAGPARHSAPARRSGPARRSSPARRSGPARAWRAWQSLPPDRRLAAGAALGLFLTLFLPWYQETGLASAGSRVQTATASLTGWAAFSWVEAAVLLVAIGVLALLFLRAEGRAFHLPGGDGGVVVAAGGWTCLLVVWRIFDKQGVTSHGQFATTSGIEWGIFFALAIAAVLAYAGSRIRAAHLPEPRLPGDEEDGEPWPEVTLATETNKRRVRGGAGTASRGGAGTASRGGAGTASRDGAGAPTRAAAPGPAPESVPTVRRARRSRRAPWAEPVTWDEPSGVAERQVPPRPAAPLHLVEPSGGEDQLRIPLDEDRPG
jgi:hypothetical protein